MDALPKASKTWIMRSIMMGTTIPSPTHPTKPKLMKARSMVSAYRTIVKEDVVGRTSSLSLAIVKEEMVG